MAPLSDCRTAAVGRRRLTAHRRASHTPPVRFSSAGRGAIFAIFILLASRPLGAQAAPSAAFLGMAVATGISQDGDGLTVLEGVHNAVWSDTMPVTEDLQLYTRWSGTGSHTIGVTIVDKTTGGNVAETTDELDFGEDPVTYSTHDFSGTKFPGDGAYAIEVTLDGTSEANYAFYVNADDQLPESPAFVLSVPAESGSVDDAGNATVSGIFEYFTFESFPAADTFSVVTLWFSGDGEFDHTVQILDPGGKKLAESSHSTFSASSGEMSVATDAFTSVAFPSAGIYTAVVFREGEKVFSFPLVITKK
jgi:hypothetical protein